MSTLLRSQNYWWGLSFKSGIGQNIARHTSKNSTCFHLLSSFFSLQFQSSQFFYFFAIHIFPVHSLSTPPKKKQKKKQQLFSDIRLRFSGSVRLAIWWNAFLPQVTCVWWTGCLSIQRLVSLYILHFFLTWVYSVATVHCIAASLTLCIMTKPWPCGFIMYLMNKYFHTVQVCDCFRCIFVVTACMHMCVYTGIYPLPSRTHEN